MIKTMSENSYIKYLERYRAVPFGGLYRIYKNPSSNKISAYNRLYNNPNIEGLKVFSGNNKHFTVAYILTTDSGLYFVVNTGMNEYRYSLSV